MSYYLIVSHNSSTVVVQDCSAKLCRHMYVCLYTAHIYILTCNRCVKSAATPPPSPPTSSPPGLTLCPVTPGNINTNENNIWRSPPQIRGALPDFPCGLWILRLSGLLPVVGGVDAVLRYSSVGYALPLVMAKPGLDAARTRGKSHFETSTKARAGYGHAGAVLQDSSAAPTT